MDDKLLLPHCWLPVPAGWFGEPYSTSLLLLLDECIDASNMPSAHIAWPLYYD